ncbi:MAG: hypothetical protein GX047_09440 [Firmicutes bacterium]|nr:hypothetical protein [Bacillota bacterium]
MLRQIEGRRIYAGEEGVPEVIWEVELPEIEERLEELQAKAAEMGAYL